MTYFIKRFDRIGRKDKLHVEDFAQLNGQARDTKYRSSMEQVAGLIEAHCTFPAVEKLKLFNGKKNRLKRRDLVDYFGRERLELTERVLDKILACTSNVADSRIMPYRICYEYL